MNRPTFESDSPDRANATPITEATVAMVLTTVADEPAAERLAHMLLEQGLAACIQIEPIRSLYHWQGKLCDESEWRLSIKTAKSRVDDLLLALRQHHPYACPQVLVLQVDRSTTDYAAWVAAETQAQHERRT